MLTVCVLLLAWTVVTSLSVAAATGTTTTNPTTMNDGDDMDCLLGLETANKNNNDGRLEMEEYVEWVHALSNGAIGNNIFAFSFEDLPQALQTNFHFLSCRCGVSSYTENCCADQNEKEYINVEGIQTNQPMTPIQLHWILKVCIQTNRAVKDAIASSTADPTGPLSDLQAEGELDPMLETIDDAPDKKPQPTGGAQVRQAPQPDEVETCLNALALSDFDGNNVLTPPEYVVLLNGLSNNSYKDTSYVNLPMALQENYQDLSNGGGGLMVMGSKPTQRPPSPQQQDALLAICRQTNRAIAQDLNIPTMAPVVTPGPVTPQPASPTTALPTPSSSTNDNAGRTVPPVFETPSLTTNTCYRYMTIADRNFDGALVPSEFVFFVNQLSNSAIPTAGNSFAALDPLLRTAFDELATDDGRLNVVGSRPGQSVGPTQQAFLRQVCDTVNRAVQCFLQECAGVPESTPQPTTRAPASPHPTTTFSGPTPAPTVNMTPQPIGSGFTLPPQSQFTLAPQEMATAQPTPAPTVATTTLSPVLTPAPITLAPITPAPTVAATKSPVTSAPVAAAAPVDTTAAPVEEATNITLAPVTSATKAPVTPAPTTVNVSEPVGNATAAPVAANPTPAPVTAAPPVATAAPVSAAPVGATKAPVVAMVNTTAAPVVVAPSLAPSALVVFPSSSPSVTASSAPSEPGATNPPSVATPAPVTDAPTSSPTIPMGLNADFTGNVTFGISNARALEAFHMVSGRTRTSLSQALFRIVEKSAQERGGGGGAAQRRRHLRRRLVVRAVSASVYRVDDMQCKPNVPSGFNCQQCYASFVVRASNEVTLTPQAIRRVFVDSVNAKIQSGELQEELDLVYPDSKVAIEEGDNIQRPSQSLLDRARQLLGLANIAYIAVGACAFLLLCYCYCKYCYCRRRRNNDAVEPVDSSPPETKKKRGWGRKK